MRQRFHFSLRTLLVGVAVISAISAWLAAEHQEARTQKDVAELVWSKGGRVCYQHEEGMLPPHLKPRRVKAGRCWSLDTAPAWLRRLVGDDLFQTATVVFVRGGDYGDAEFEAIGKLKHVRLLYVSNACLSVSPTGLDRFHRSHPDCEIGPFNYQD